MLPTDRKATQHSVKLDTTDAAIIKLLSEDLGFQHKRIAALFDVNQGRISEIVSGKKFETVESLRAYWQRGRWEAGVKEIVE